VVLGDHAGEAVEAPLRLGVGEAHGEAGRLVVGGGADGAVAEPPVVHRRRARQRIEELGEVLPVGVVIVVVPVAEQV
jgi:hypothetical protein